MERGDLNGITCIKPITVTNSFLKRVITSSRMKAETRNVIPVKIEYSPIDSEDENDESEKNIVDDLKKSILEKIGQEDFSFANQYSILNLAEKICGTMRINVCEEKIKEKIENIKNNLKREIDVTKIENFRFKNVKILLKNLNQLQPFFNEKENNKFIAEGLIKLIEKDPPKWSAFSLYATKDEIKIFYQFVKSVESLNDISKIIDEIGVENELKNKVNNICELFRFDSFFLLLNDIKA
jgi:hypothetical protein